MFRAAVSHPDPEHPESTLFQFGDAAGSDARARITLEEAQQAYPSEDGFVHVVQELVAVAHDDDGQATEHEWEDR